MSTTSTNAEGVRTIVIGDASNGIELTVIPDAGNDIGVTVDIEGRGSAVIANGGLRLDTGLAAKLATELFTLLTG